MAVYFLRSRHISRGKGARATRAAAYRAGERIRDERTSEVYDYTRRDDVVYKDIVIPADLASQPDMAWTQDRSALWNAARQDFARRESAPRQPRWSQLTRGERNALRRKQYLARRALEKQDPVLEQRRREAVRRSYLAEKAKHPEVLRERAKRYRSAHRDAFNANQREYRRKRRELQQSQSSSAGQSVTTEQSLQNWNAYRQQHGTGPTAEESLHNWNEYRARARELANAAPAAQPAPEHDPHQNPRPDRDHDLGM